MTECVHNTALCLTDLCIELERFENLNDPTIPYEEAPSSSGEEDSLLVGRNLWQNKPQRTMGEGAGRGVRPIKKQNKKRLTVL